MGDHHPQLGAALPGVVGIFGQAVYLFQHPRGLLDEPPPLLSGDHAGGRALKDAQAVFLFQILQRLADVGLGGVELLCRSAHRPPFLDRNEITQFRDVQSPSSPCQRRFPSILSAQRQTCQAVVDGPDRPAYNKGKRPAQERGRRWSRWSAAAFCASKNRCMAAKSCPKGPRSAVM